jgi:hypothetical protein
MWGGSGRRARTDTRLVPQCPHPHLRRVSLSVGYPFPRNPGECGNFHVRVALKSSWLPGEAGGCPYPSARGGRGGLGAQDVVEIPTGPRNKNAALPVRTHKSPLTLSGLKKLGWQTELESHSFRCFEVMHIASWDQESAALGAFLHPKERA